MEVSISTRHTLGWRIKQARNAANLSQERLAEALGVERLQVIRWEHGRALPSIERLPTMAAVLRVTQAWLLGEGDAAPQTPVEERLAALEAKLDAILSLLGGRDG